MLAGQKRQFSPMITEQTELVGEMSSIDTVYIFCKNVDKTIQKSYPWRTNLRPIQEAMEWTEEARPGFTTLMTFLWFLPAQVKVEVKSAGREKTKYKKTDSPVSPVLSPRKSGTIQYLSKAWYMHVTWQIKSIFLEAIKVKLDRKMTR